MAFLECSDPARYNTLLSSLRNNPLTGAYHYQKTLTYSLNLPNHYRPPVEHTTPQYGGGNQQCTNVQFNQVKGTGQQCEAIACTYRNTRSDVTCYNFQRPGHICLFCPNGANIQAFQVTLYQSGNYSNETPPNMNNWRKHKGMTGSCRME